MNIELKDLVGERYFSGIDEGQEDYCNFVKFILDGVIYKAIEDPEDGYRSCLGSIAITNEAVKNSFIPQKMNCVMTPDRDYRQPDILQLFDCETKGLVLEIGTDSSDEYYPICVMSFTPENMAINQQQQSREKNDAPRQDYSNPKF